MPTSLGGVLSYFRRFAPDGPAAEDRDLLSRFAGGDGSAFAALAGRYAPLVWGVCRRLLGPSADAEDAFQATFVVLAKKAPALADGRPLGPWLHKVARDTAARARARSARRRAREAPLSVEPAADHPAELESREVGAALEEEVSRLPERYRGPVVLCYLEGLTNEEAARRLACPKGTVLSRLSRAREQLRQRLARRGIEPSAVMLPAALIPEPVPEALVAAAGRAAAAAGFSASVRTLAKGVVFTMFLRKLRVAGFVLLAMAVTASGIGWVSHRPVTPPAQVALPAAARKLAAAPAAKLEEKPEPGKPGTREAELAELLKRTVDFSGWDDPKTTLIEGLDHLAKVHRVTFDVNEKAFKRAGLETVLGTLVTESNPIPPMKAPLGRVLKTALARLPVDAVFLIRKDLIEITTLKAARAELGLKENWLARMGLAAEPPLVLVWEEFRKVPLENALAALSASTGANIVVDARVEEKAAAKVSARLMNVSIDNAVRVLADMAGLAVVRLENVLYVTSPENAARLKKK
jgi:RNA polymerase sigma factor (sigma-70 family)